ncbi:hypothetical protein TFLX_05744 [Thermoflexales bacterium]|nr:hypothetical protein TFLX_05744 [Thermoflexales bacterium]
MSKQLATLSGVTVEWDDAKHAKIRVAGGPLDNAKLMYSKNNDDEFTPARVIINLKLDLGDSAKAEVALDDVHLKIPYEGEKPTVGWWNNAKWVTFKQVTYANNVADITLPSPWPTDPPIGLIP